MGVFATRSPCRPNPIGLSVVRLEGILEGKEGLMLAVSGADLVDGTPIYDIKPYLPFADVTENASGGFADSFRTMPWRWNCPKNGPRFCRQKSFRRFSAF